MPFWFGQPAQSNDKMPTNILQVICHKIFQALFYRLFLGRTRLEPVTIVILSVIMCSASIEVILESSRALALDIDYFAHPFNASSCRTLQYIDMSTLPVIAMVFTISEFYIFLWEKILFIYSFLVTKLILFLLCYRINNPMMLALAEDNRNDVLSNFVALVCGVIGNFNPSA